LAQVFQQLQQTAPQIQESADNHFRLTDWTFDVQGLTPETIATLQAQCDQLGWSFTYSTVQCHIKLPGQDKARGLQQVIQQYWPEIQPEQVLTVGDSPNDEPLFNPQLFPNSVGVANLLHYCDQENANAPMPMTHLPRFITAQPEGAGFLEVSTLSQQQLQRFPHSPKQADEA
jgi:hydroxymethylpyrimidine pyrophosphatase-like HAD family hydrolase